MYRIDVLLKQDRRLFHTRDLAVLWGVTNDNTLYTHISRYVKKGILQAVWKGLYATVPVSDINPFELGLSMLHRYAYISCEYVLARSGAIFQSSDTITLVSTISRSFTMAGHHYVVRQMSEGLVYQTPGISVSDGIRMANPERAAADMLYYQPNFHFDNRLAINWTTVKVIQKEVGFL